MRLRFRSVLFAMTIILMTASLGAVAAFVFIRNNESSCAISTLQINQAATDVEERIARFLEKGPQALDRMQRLVNGKFLNLYDAERLEAYLIAEMRADRDLTWLSYSNAQTGAFIGVTHRDGMLILNRAALETDGGRPREWQVLDDNTRLPTPPRLQVPYDPRTAPWFRLGLEATRPRWTDLYKFAEGEWGISAVLRLRPPERGSMGGVITADFHLRVIDEFLNQLHVGERGRAAVVLPRSTGGSVVLGEGSLPPEMKSTLAAAEATIATAGRVNSPLSNLDFRQPAGGIPIVTSIRALAPGGERPWFLTVMIPAEEVDGPIHQATRDILVVSVIFLTLGIVVASWLAGMITRPIRSMSEDLRRVGELRFSSSAPSPSIIYEMDTMGKTLAAMKACLRSFSLYVPQELVRSTLNSGHDVKPGGETRDLTVMFTDVADFTKIAEALSPEQLSQDLGKYFDIVEGAITQTGGLLDKFMGDGTMALFNAPEILADHAASACEAALSVQDLLQTFNTQREAEDLIPFRTRIGIALGQAMVGNIGSSHRLAYTAIGDVVNLSSHLESLNKVYGTTILADGTVYMAAGKQFEWRHLDRIAVAGRSAPMELYELLGRRGSVDPEKLLIRDLHETALRALIAGDFETAERGFAVIISSCPHDHAAGVLLAYTAETKQAFAVMRPSGWSGVHVYRSKRPT